MICTAGDSLPAKSGTSGKYNNEHINLFTGQLIYSHNTIATSGALANASVAHYYESCKNTNSTNNHCGKGWRMSVQQSVRASEYDYWDLLICMDKNNLRNLARITADPEGKVRLLLDYAGRKGAEVADPWWSGNFDETWCDVLEGCRGLLKVAGKRQWKGGKNELFFEKKYLWW